VSRAGDPRQAARSLRDEINRLREDVLKPGERQRVEPAAPLAETRFTPSLVVLAEALLEGGCVRFGAFTLKSGLQSPIYLDLRRLVGDPRLLGLAAEAYLPVLRRLAFDRLAALPYAALPIATAISLQGGWPLVYPRKEVKAYGTRAEVEGVFEAGERVVVIDDLATTGGSKFEAIEKLAAADLQVQDVVVLIDRQSGAARALAEAGFRLHAVFTLTGLLDHWEGAGRIPVAVIDQVRDFLRNSGSEG
jgi:uridine monophosphate synthetase